MGLRNHRGATLALIISIIGLIVVMGVCFFSLSELFGGGRELQNATDSGSLNVSKQALKHPGVTLESGEEVEHFAGLIDNQAGEINLLSYNRCVGEALLIAMNASAEGTPEAYSNAQKVMEMVQGSENSIGKRLYSKLSNAGEMASHFSTLAGSNSVRMLGLGSLVKANDPDYKVGFVKPATATNVDIHPNSLPYVGTGSTRLLLPATAQSTKDSSRGFKYFSGYVAINIPNINKELVGVPLRPGNTPHLITVNEFTQGQSHPGIAGTVPPNSFKASGKATKSKAVSCAVVGSLAADYTASIPHGYIVIRNGKGTAFAGAIGDNTSIFANELMVGIFVGPGAGSNRAFTTNGSQYYQWLDYNTKVANGTTPLPPVPSSAGVFGDPHSITSGPSFVNWTNYNGNPSSPAADMLTAFQNAYHRAPLGQSFNSGGDTLMAVEKYKASILEAFSHVTTLHDPFYKVFIPAPAGTTGLKAFGHGKHYPAPTVYPVNFGQPGSLSDFTNQTNAASVYRQIEQRMYQIKPDASAGERNNILNNIKIGMDATMYIYKDPSGNLTMTSNQPPWVSGGIPAPDGRRQVFASTYNIQGSAVNTIGGMGTGDAGTVQPYNGFPASTGTDTCYWTPSSGYHNLLGEVSFTNQVGGGGGGGDGGGTYTEPN